MFLGSAELRVSPHPTGAYDLSGQCGHALQCSEAIIYCRVQEALLPPPKSATQLRKTTVSKPHSLHHKKRGRTFSICLDPLG